MIFFTLYVILILVLSHFMTDVQDTFLASQFLTVPIVLITWF